MEADGKVSEDMTVWRVMGFLLTWGSQIALSAYVLWRAFSIRSTLEQEDMWLSVVTLSFLFVITGLFMSVVVFFFAGRF